MDMKEALTDIITRRVTMINGLSVASTNRVKQQAIIQSEREVDDTFGEDEKDEEF